MRAASFNCILNIQNQISPKKFVYQTKIQNFMKLFENNTKLSCLRFHLERNVRLRSRSSLESQKKVHKVNLSGRRQSILSRQVGELTERFVQDAKNRACRSAECVCWMSRQASGSTARKHVMWVVGVKVDFRRELCNQKIQFNFSNCWSSVQWGNHCAIIAEHHH